MNPYTGYLEFEILLSNIILHRQPDVPCPCAYYFTRINTFPTSLLNRPYTWLDERNLLGAYTYPLSFDVLCQVFYVVFTLKIFANDLPQQLLYLAQNEAGKRINHICINRS